MVPLQSQSEHLHESRLSRGRDREICSFARLHRQSLVFLLEILARSVASVVVEDMQDAVYGSTPGTASICTNVRTALASFKKRSFYRVLLCLGDEAEGWSGREILSLT